MSDLKSLKACKVNLAPNAVRRYEARIRRSKNLRKRIKENEFVMLLDRDRAAGKHTDVALVAGDGTR